MAVTTTMVSNNLGIYTLLWIDNHGSSTVDNLDLQQKLESVEKKLKIFHSVTECVSYLINVKDVKVIAIVSSNCADQIIPLVHDCKHLLSLYIYDNNMKSVTSSINYQKVKGTYNSLDELIIHLTEEYRIRKRKYYSLPINIYNRSTTKETSKQDQRSSRNAVFMYLQLFVDILLRMPPSDHEKAKQELLDMWKKYANRYNAQDHRVIKEFDERYKDNDAIRWYTKEPFLFSNLNKALRENDMNILYTMRFFILDLYRRLVHVHIEETLPKYQNNDAILQVYRGQAIGIDELNLIRESKGEFILFNSFLSASNDRPVAMMFAKSSILSITETVTCILFEFIIDSRLPNTKAFPNITNFSYFKDEEEILIMFGSIFRIVDVNFDEDQQIWIAKLTLCSETDYELQNLMKQMKAQIVTQITSLGYLLYTQGNYTMAIQYFEQLLEEPLLSDSNKANCYRGLGAVYIKLEEYDEALDYHQKELELWKKRNNEKAVAQAYTSIGEVYGLKNKHDEALLHLEKARGMLPVNDPDLSAVYRTMADIYDDQDMFTLAVSYYEKALHIDTEHLEQNHVVFANTYQNIGVMYKRQGNCKKALEYYEQARQIYLQSLSPNHPSLIQLRQNIRSANGELDQYYRVQHKSIWFS